MRSFYCTTILILLFGFGSYSQTKLPVFFADDMVLQQQQMVSIWGTDKPGASIKVKGSWGSKAATTASKDGAWKLQLQTPAAGGPYNVQIKGSNTIELKNVLIGEIWFCSGQSNMEMPMKGYNNQPILGSNEAILNSKNDQIRFFNTGRNVSLVPLADAKGNWKTAHPSTTGNFSATAYFFAKKLQAVLGVPVGIIQSAWGASTIESWMNQETLQPFASAVIPQKIPDSMPQKVPTMMYNTMLHPFIGFNIRGVLWYQGESNRLNANEYEPMFTAMLKDWRKQWNHDSLPFYFAQIAPHEPGKINAAFLREAQLKSMQANHHTGMAVTMDIGDRTLIHPANKQPVGERLAYWALAKTYKINGIAFSGPVYKQHNITPNGRIILSFDYCDLGLSSFGNELTDFEIAGADKIFYPAKAMIQTDKKGNVVVWSDSVKNPVAVRYAFKNWAEGSLFNTQGLPASSFRTDDW